MDETLDILPQNFLTTLLYRENTKGDFLITLATSKMVHKYGVEFFERVNGPWFQSIEALLCQPCQCGMKNSTLHSIAILMQERCVLKVAHVLLRIRSSSILLDLKGKEITRQFLC